MGQREKQKHNPAEPNGYRLDQQPTVNGMHYNGTGS